MQDYLSVVNFFRQSEWENEFSNGLEVAQLLKVDRLVQLGAHTISGEYWRAMAVAMASSGGVSAQAMSHAVRFHFTETLKDKIGMKRGERGSKIV